MRLAGRKIPGWKVRGGRNQLNGTITPVSPGNEFVVFSHLLVIRQPVECNTRAKGDTKLDGSQNGSFGSALRNVQNVAGLELQVFGLTVQDFLQIELHFVLLSLGVLSNDYSMVRLRGSRKTAGQRENFQGIQLLAVIGENKSPWPGNGSQNIHDACVWNRHNVARLQLDIVLDVARLHQLIQINSDSVRSDGRLRSAQLVDGVFRWTVRWRQRRRLRGLFPRVRNIRWRRRDFGFWTGSLSLDRARFGWPSRGRF